MEGAGSRGRRGVGDCVGLGDSAGAESWGVVSGRRIATLRATSATMTDAKAIRFRNTRIMTIWDEARPADAWREGYLPAPGATGGRSPGDDL